MDNTDLGIVHHVELFFCENAVIPDTNPQRCGIDTLMQCDLVISLARGSSVTLPSEVQYPQDSGMYILEVHLALVNKAGVDMNNIDVSGSGLRRYYTTSERAKKLGVIRMELGEFTIPPNRKHYEISGAMHQSCTERFFPKEGIDIVLLGGHMHFLGDQIRLDRITQDRGIKTLLEIKKWDINRQLGHVLTCIHDHENCQLLKT